MDFATKINIILCILSFLLAAISIIFVVLTIRQNSKMIEEATRPNIQIYPELMEYYAYIVIKNFGQSSAYIDSVTCNHKFNKAETLNDDIGKNIFDMISNSFLAPGHSIKCPLIAHKVFDVPFEFKIKYHANNKIYTDTFCFKMQSNFPFADLLPDGKKSDDHLKNISKYLNTIAKSNL